MHDMSDNTSAADPLAIEVTNIVKNFPLARTLSGRVVSQVHAVNYVSLSIPRGKTLGLVGESGSGKSTVGRIVARLLAPDAGTISFNGRVVGSSKEDEQLFRDTVQIVLQDPFSALDPMKTIGHAVTEPLNVRKRGKPSDRHRIAKEMLERVGLSEEYMRRYPAELSGGQRQRACVARALVLEPKILVADEPTSALDLSTRSEILNLFLELQESMGISVLLISHDFATIGHLSHEVAVMYLGRIVEQGPVKTISTTPTHPYAQALVSAVQSVDVSAEENRAKRIAVEGPAPSPVTPPSGCHFHTRCPFATRLCATDAPPLQPTEDGPEHLVACHLVHRPTDMEASPELTDGERMTAAEPSNA